jgi:hypothetical protein
MPERVVFRTDVWAHQQRALELWGRDDVCDKDVERVRSLGQGLATSGLPLVVCNVEILVGLTAGALCGKRPDTRLARWRAIHTSLSRYRIFVFVQRGVISLWKLVSTAFDLA